MQKNIIIGMVLFLSVFTACSDWLDVDPADKELEDTFYETETGINTVLNGIYMGMAKNELYGANLSATSIEFLGQQYYTTNLSTQTQQVPLQFAVYNYKEEEGKKVIRTIWSSMYAQILEVNKFLVKMEEVEILSETKKNILLGEGHGLRAFMHFDLLRLFGPVYSEKPEEIAIPYNLRSDGLRSPHLPASEVMDYILSDLDKAIGYLAEDPIITNGPLVSLTGDDAMDFYRLRNRRMNYYAVKALKSRVLLYKGDLEEAEKLADEVIQVAEAIFPWTTSSQFSNNQNPDRIFSSEVIFGIHNMDMYSNWTDYFSPVLNENALYGALETVLMNKVFTATGTVFDDLSDLRAKNWRTVTGTTIRASYKFQDGQRDTSLILYYQPLIRLSELYYIKSEVALEREDADQARIWLDVVRENRILPAMAETSTVDQVEVELTKEYIREFYGEGQVFYYYKRRNKATIMNANTTATTGTTATVAMDEEKYVIPIPDEELEKQ